MPESTGAKQRKKGFEPRILVFACNWCSYAGADSAGVSRLEYAPNVRLLRVMCSGRVHPSFVLKAFMEGADGVMVSGCHFGDCHYMFGNHKAVEQFEKVKALTRLLGLEPDRIALEWISAAEGPRFADVMNQFTEQVRNLGPSPLLRKKKTISVPVSSPMNLRDYRVFTCLECGRCTAVCPVARTHEFSPRRLLSSAISQGLDGMSSDAAVWDCLTCRRCEEVCPADIPYSELNRATRAETVKKDVPVPCTHGGVFEQVSIAMARSGLKQNRLEWLTPSTRTRKQKGKILFFTGCSPYFAGYFGTPYAEKLQGSLNAAVTLLNRMDIEPVVMANERCCGHDLLLRGDTAGFARQAGLVADQIRKTGAETVVFTCPECLVTVRDDIPKVTGTQDVTCVHLSELLAPEIDKLEFTGKNGMVTYQDPCRLGRYSGVYDPPREIICHVNSGGVNEMRHHRERAVCCGNTAWINCDAGTKVLQNQRLADAAATGSETLLTACPKCLVHLTCAQEGDNGENQKQVSTRDIWDYVATRLDKRKKGGSVNGQ